jgi:hypothetical protein
MVPALPTMRWPRVRDHTTIGASTGYMSDARSEWPVLARRAASESIAAVEFSALSEPELPGLIEWLEQRPSLPFQWTGAHGPTKGRQMEERDLVDALLALAAHVDVVVLHPDTMQDPSLYRELGSALAIENMDARKPVGQTAEQLEAFFDALPDARLCFDVAHAGAIDPSMIEGERILDAFASRLSHVHVSSLDEASHHVSLSSLDEQRFTPLLDRCRDVPWILEAPLAR